MCGRALVQSREDRCREKLRLVRPCGSFVVAALAAWAGCTSGGHGADAAEERQRLESCAVAQPAEAGGAEDDELTGGSDGVEVVFWHAEGDPRGALLDELVEEFNEAHRTISATVVEMPGRDTLMTRWREADVAERPSMVLLPQEMTRRTADSMQTVEPEECLQEVYPDLLPVIEAAWSVEGVVQAVPFAVTTPVMFYSREAFEAAGLDPETPPRTLGELREQSQQLVDTGVVSTGLVFNTAPSAGGSWFVNQWNAQVGELSLEPANGRGRPAGDVHASFQTGPAADHLAWLHAMVADGLATSLGQNAHGPDNLVPLFEDQSSAAMAFYTSGALETVDTMVGTGLGVAPLPGPGNGSLPGGAALWLSAGKPAAETQAAWSLAVFLASPSVQARWAAEMGTVPVSMSARADESLVSAWDAQPQLAVPYEVMADQGVSPAELGMSAGPQQVIDVLLADTIDAVIEGEDSTAALSAVADDIDHLLAVYQSGQT